MAGSHGTGVRFPLSPLMRKYLRLIILVFLIIFWILVLFLITDQLFRSLFMAVLVLFSVIFIFTSKKWRGNRNYRYGIIKRGFPWIH